MISNVMARNLRFSYHALQKRDIAYIKPATAFAKLKHSERRAGFIYGGSTRGKRYGVGQKGEQHIAFNGGFVIYYHGRYIG
jgi:predicted choloylglycine hydrolase